MLLLVLATTVAASEQDDRWLRPAASPTDGSYVVGPPYTAQPALLPHGRTRGRLFNISMPMAASRLFNGSDPTFTACDGPTPGECCIPAKGMCKVDAVRQVLVYVPAALAGTTLGDAPILCMQDGPGWFREVSFALDNLAPSRLVPFVAISVENGGSDAIKSERGLEYDTLSDRYARFLDTEVLPAVLRHPELRAAYPSLAFTTDPAKRGLFGCSSGGAAALTAGWFRPDLFRRVAAYSGTFVDQQDHDAPSAAEFPFGAWGYHSAQRLIATAPRKPLRIFTHNSEYDLGYNTAASAVDDKRSFGSNTNGDHTSTDPTLHNWTDHHHNWKVAGNRTAQALEARGYSYRHVFSQGTHHCDPLAINATLADTLLWLWAEDETIAKSVDAAAFIPQQPRTVSGANGVLRAKSDDLDGSFDFTFFEDELFGAWQARFLVGDAAVGEYSLKPVSNPAYNRTSLYGTTDMVYARHATGQLDGMSSQERRQWAETINSFQNRTTGWYELQAFESMHCANPPYANHTWHAAGAAVETLRLLASSGPGAQPRGARLPSYAYSPVRFRSVDELMEGGAAEWRAFVERWLSGYADVWMGSQAVQSLVAIVKLSQPTLPPQADAFWNFLFGYLNQTSDSHGMWDGTPHQDAIHQIGGAFHVYHVYQCFPEVPSPDSPFVGLGWPHSAASVDATLSAQDNSSGVWGGKHDWVDRRSWGTISSCIDLDGVYTLTRAAKFASVNGEPYRWAEVEGACRKYLRTASFLLNNRTQVLDPTLYGQDTHLLHGVLYAVAECQQHFPQLVRTRRPWRRWTDAASCIYA